jgi:hypothetical protein
LVAADRGSVRKYVSFMSTLNVVAPPQHVEDDMEKLLTALDGVENENEAERERERREREEENRQWQALLEETEDQWGRVLQTRCVCVHTPCVSARTYARKALSHMHMCTGCYV